MCACHSRALCLPAQAALALEPSNSKALLRLAKAKMATGAAPAALAALDRAMLLDPRDETARNERRAAAEAARRLDAGAAALAAGDWSRALGMLDGAAAACPASYALHAGRLDALMGLGRLDDADALVRGAAAP